MNIRCVYSLLHNLRWYVVLYEEPVFSNKAEDEVEQEEEKDDVSGRSSEMNSYKTGESDMKSPSRCDEQGTHV